MKSALISALALLIAAPAIQAQDVKFGGQVTLSLPMGDIGKKDMNATGTLGSSTSDTPIAGLDGKMGYGLGFNAQFDLKGGHAATPRLDWTTYKRSTDGGDFKVNTLNLGLDYNYFLDGKVNEGFYLLGGVGLSRIKLEYNIPGLSFDTNKTGFYAQVGGGYHFTSNMAAELRYVHNAYSGVKFDFGGGNLDLGSTNLGALQASFVVRF